MSGARAGPMSTDRESKPASVAAVRHGDALDVANLPSYGFGTRSLMWWGTAGMIAIEGVAFAFMIVIYFYLRSLSGTWPSSGASPDLLWGTVNLGLILLSAIPNIYIDKWAIEHDLPKVRVGLVIFSIFCVLLLVVRALEFTALRARGTTTHGSKLQRNPAVTTEPASPSCASAGSAITAATDAVRRSKATASNSAPTSLRSRAWRARRAGWRRSGRKARAAGLWLR